MKKKIAEMYNTEDLTRHYTFTLTDNRTNNITTIKNTSMAYIIEALKSLDKTIVQNHDLGTKVLGKNQNSKSINKNEIDNR